MFLYLHPCNFLAPLSQRYCRDQSPFVYIFQQLLRSSACVMTTVPRVMVVDWGCMVLVRRTARRLLMPFLMQHVSLFPMIAAFDDGVLLPEIKIRPTDGHGRDARR